MKLVKKNIDNMVLGLFQNTKDDELWVASIKYLFLTICDDIQNNKSEFSLLLKFEVIDAIIHLNKKQLSKIIDYINENRNLKTFTEKSFNKRYVNYLSKILKDNYQKYLNQLIKQAHPEEKISRAARETLGKEDTIENTLGNTLKVATNPYEVEEEEQEKIILELYKEQNVFNTLSIFEQESLKYFSEPLQRENLKKITALTFDGICQLAQRAKFKLIYFNLQYLYAKKKLSSKIKSINNNERIIDILEGENTKNIKYILFYTSGDIQYLIRDFEYINKLKSKIENYSITSS
jgi:hypothetical protein